MGRASISSQLQCTWSSSDASLLPTSFLRARPKKFKEPPQPHVKMPGGLQSGGLMSQGYAPPGQFEDIINMIRQSQDAATRAMKDAKMAEMAASAAGAGGQQAIVRFLHYTAAPGHSESLFGANGPTISTAPSPDVVALLTNTRTSATDAVDGPSVERDKMKQRLSANEFLSSLERHDVELVR
mmetsp:Transcript_113165/g.207863  ORF Transcript_113165/g.207863 Transcript_113165/m.207863 type:complete len:183 (-) Transcript_113165:43-591(-)